MRTFLKLGLFALLLPGCGATMYRASGNVPLNPESAKEINDDDVQKAFDAHPQMPAKAKVAYYSFDDGKAQDLEGMLKTIPAVESTYKIAPLLVTGQRKYAQPWEAPPQQEISIKKLRLLAA